MSRNRTIYQSESLFVGDSINASGENENHELIRVQGANYGFSLNKQDITQYGRQLRLDTVQLESPTVNFDFSYYLGDGLNEKNIGFDVNSDKQFVGPFMDSFSGNNFYMITSDEGFDAVDFKSGDNYSLVGVGNAYLTNYNLDMSVGSAPRVELSYQAANINSQNGQVSGRFITGSMPSINPEEDQIISGIVKLKKPKDRGASRPSVIRPGDITLEFPGFQSNEEGPISKTEGAGSFHMQSASLSLPLNRSELYRVGTKHSYARVLDYPINGTLTVATVLSDIESENLINIISDCRDQGGKDICLSLSKCKKSEYGINLEGTEKAMKITLKGVDLISETFTSQVGSNKAVDVAFRVQVGSEDDLSRGVLVELFNNCFLIAEQEETIVYTSGGLEYSPPLYGDIPQSWMESDLDAKEVSIGSGVSTIGPESFRYAGLDGNLIIPDNVRLIDTYAFSSCYELTSLEIGKYLSGIGDNAFDSCTSLSSINFCSSNELKNIGEAAFISTNLTNITIPESIQTLGSYVFANTTSLQNADLTSEITAIPIGAFRSNTSLQSVQYTNSVSVIEEQSFTGCTNLSQVSWSTNLQSIGISSFMNCSSLPYVEFTENLESIGARSFKNCFSLAGNLEIPDSVSSIGAEAFYGCVSLTGVDLGSGVVNLPNSMFYNCSKLKNITFQDNLQSIGPSCFYSCESLSGVIIPDSVQSIEASAFSYCHAGTKGLRDITLGSGLKVIGTSAFFGSKLLDTALLPSGLEQIYSSAFRECALTGHVEIPNSVFFVGDNAFDFVSELKGVTLSTSMDTVNEGCFANCDSLTGIDIPANIIDIEKDGFSDCDSLSGINFSEGLETIGEKAFQLGNSLTGVSFPSSLRSIGVACFFDCDDLTSGVFLNEGLLSIGSQAFSRCDMLSGITYPQSLETVDDSCFTFCSSLLNVNFNTNPSFDTISQNCFYQCSSLTGIVIPDNIDTIQDSAFIRCSSLSGIDFGNSIITIGSQAFRSNAFYELSFPSTLTHIYSYAFESCSSLQDIGVLPSNLQVIGDNAFDKTSLTGLLTIPDSVTYLGSTAFANCLVSGVNLGLGVDYLNNQAFLGCLNLEYINLDLITGIGNNVFDGCSSLSGIAIPNTMKEIGNSAFRGSAIYDITIPDLMDYIADNCFSQCNNLTGVISGINITGIESHAFQNCGSLLEYYAPNSLFEIGTSAFESCTSLSGLDLNSVETIKSSAFEFCSSLSGKLVIPDVTTTIENEAFKGTSYSGVHIGSGIDSLEASVFQDCLNLSYIEIPSGVSSVSAETFNLCTALTGIKFNDGLTTISPRFGDYNPYTGSFQFCTSLSGTVELPSTLEFLGRNAFKHCTSIDAIRFTSTVAPKTRRDALPAQFSSDPSNHIVYAPLGSEASYSGFSYVEEGNFDDPVNWNSLNIVFE